jgi:hypothetical protein
MLALAHRLFQFPLAIAEQGVDFAVGIIADGVDLRSTMHFQNVICNADRGRRH